MSNMGPREPHNDMVICPNCTCQFVAIPVAVTAEIDALRERIRQAHDLIFLYACDEIVAEWEATPEVQRALEQEPKP